MCIWRVDLNQLSMQEYIVEKMYVIFEYPTVFGNTAMVRIEAKEYDFRLIKENFENLAKQFIEFQKPA